MKKGISEQGIKRIAQEMGGNSEDRLFDDVSMIREVMIAAAVELLESANVEDIDTALELVKDDAGSMFDEIEQRVDEGV